LVAADVEDKGNTVLQAEAAEAADLAVEVLQVAEREAHQQQITLVEKVEMVLVQAAEETAILTE
jgi:hypothetical protein